MFLNRLEGTSCVLLEHESGEKTGMVYKLISRSEAERKLGEVFLWRKWTVALNHLKYMVCGFIGVLTFTKNNVPTYNDNRRRFNVVWLEALGWEVTVYFFTQRWSNLKVIFNVICDDFCSTLKIISNQSCNKSYNFILNQFNTLSKFLNTHNKEMILKN